MKIIPIIQEQPKSAPTISVAETPITVNGVLISVEDIAAEAQNHPMPQDKPEWAWASAAHALVLRELLLQAARAHSIQPSPIELETGQWETTDEALVRGLLEQEIQPLESDQSVLKAMYEANPSRFCAPSLYEAAHILIPFSAEDPQQRDKAYSQAQIILTELQNNASQFATLAKQYSACPSKASGGSLGQLAPGDTVPEFEAALAMMPEGSISLAPLETRYGFHIIRLDARERGQVLPFETVLPYLQEAQDKSNWVRAGRDYMQQLVEQAVIEGVDLADQPWLEAIQ